LRLASAGVGWDRIGACFSCPAVCRYCQNRQLAIKASSSLRHMRLRHRVGCFHLLQSRAWHGCYLLIVLPVLLMGAGVAAGHMAATRTAHCLHDVCTGKAESTQVGMNMLLTQVRLSG
jgi:hypothetical protein